MLILSRRGPWNIDYDLLCHFKTKALEQDVDPVYRLISGTSPTLSDFEPKYFAFSMKGKCIGFGTSVFKDKDDNKLKNIMKTPNYKCKNIAVGRIGKKDGKVLHSEKSSHITWWITINEPHKQFKILP